MLMQSQIDTQRLPIKGLRAEQSASAPLSPVEGLFWHDTANNLLKIYLASNWVDLSLTTPTGPAGGVLSGTYPNPGFATGAIASTAPFAAAMMDGPIGTATLRTIGTGAQQAMAGATRLDQIPLPTASVNLNNQKITNLATPTAVGDAASKGYVDSVSQGLTVKAPVRVGSTANVTVTYSATGGTSGRGQITAAPNALDGVTLAANDRILLKNQTTGAQNGIWVVTTLGTGANGVWDRATDYDTDAEVVSGNFVFVSEGTQNADSGWVLTTNNPIVIGGASGTALTFAQFSGAGQITAGAGLTKTGNTLDVVGTANRITVAADSIDISTAYVGQTSITTLGTIGTGVWQGTAVALGFGGTGATTAAGARANLGTPTELELALPALTAGVWTALSLGITLSDLDRWDVRFYVTATKETCWMDSRSNSTTAIDVRADVPLASGDVTAVVTALG